MKKLLLFCLPALMLFSCTRQVTLETLLTEMADRDAIAQYPQPNYTLKQFSSYDRATTVPGDASWFANWDRSMFIRTDTMAGRSEYVMMEADGPGAIVRFWMTFAGENSGKGILRIYFDGDSVPAIEGAAFDVLSGTLLTTPPLATSVSDSTEYERRGHNLYLPLPYARSCKVTYQSENIRSAGAKKGGEACYYNINYRTYTSKVKVTTWSAREMEKASATLARVQQELDTKEMIPEPAPDGLGFPVTLAPGASRSDTLTGKQAIRLIRISVSPDIDPQQLRSTVIEMTFDGERTGWCPLGDFFGTGYQLRYSKTWYTSVDPSGDMEARWVMPFKKSVVITLHNFGKESVTIPAVIYHSTPWKWNSRSMHFGTSWRQYTNLETGKSKDNEGNGGAFDINYVTLNGKGVYAGDGITLFNTMYSWWGEGDEKVFVDGESFPSSIGTGTEDYYGYAWCRPEKFANHPYIAQPDGSGNFWPGYTVNMRYRGLDAIPFGDSLRFDMEMWHWAKATVNHAPVTRWYMLPGGKANIMPDTAGVTEPVALKRSDIISPWISQGKIEGENLVFAGVSGGNFEYQHIERFNWSGDVQAFWTRGKAGDHLEMLFYSADSLQAQVTARLTKAPDYGIVRISLNGKPVSGNIDLVADKVSPADVNLGDQLIRRGRNLLRIDIAGTSARDGKAYFGLDYITFTKR